MGTETEGTALLVRHIERIRERADRLPVKQNFANAAAITPVELAHFLSGRRTPNLSQAVRISDATAGAVPVRAWTEEK